MGGAGTDGEGTGFGGPGGRWSESSESEIRGPASGTVGSDGTGSVVETGRDAGLSGTEPER